MNRKARRIVAKRRHMHEANREYWRTPQPIKENYHDRRTKDAEDINEGGRYGQLESLIVADTNRLDKISNKLSTRALLPLVQIIEDIEVDDSDA